MIAIIGSGCWATAIVKILLETSNRELYWWVRSDEVYDSLCASGRNSRHLPSLQLDTYRLHIDTDLAHVVAAADTLLLAVPSVYVTEVLSQLPIETYHGKRFISAIKGFVPQHQQSLSQYLHLHLQVPFDDICVVSGPSHAEEVAEGMTTFLTVASFNRLFADEIAGILCCRYIHTSVSDEVDAIELCGLTKNIYAIAAGLAHGLGYGDNLIAVLTTAAAHELQGFFPETTLAFRLLSDLLVTCFSHHSRNRALGEAVACGISPDYHFRTSGMVAEGYYSAAIMHNMERPSATPIADAVFDILYRGADPHERMEYLINNVL